MGNLGPLAPLRAKEKGESGEPPRGSVPHAPSEGTWTEGRGGAEGTAVAPLTAGGRRRRRRRRRRREEEEEEGWGCAG